MPTSVPSAPRDPRDELPSVEILRLLANVDRTVRNAATPRSLDRVECGLFDATSEGATAHGARVRATGVVVPPSSVCERAAAYVRRGDAREGAEQYLRALAILDAASKPTDGAERRRAMLAIAARAHVGLGHETKDAKHYATAYALSPNDHVRARALEGIGLLHERAGNDAIALHYACSARAQNPQRLLARRLDRQIEALRKRL